MVGVFVANENLIAELVQKEFNRKEKPLPKFYKINDYIIYRVRPGDYLGKIARKYKTSVSKIKRWNGLRTNRLRVGQKLKIYRRYHHLVSNNKSNNLKKKTTNNTNKKHITYKVKQGDTLWNISRKYKVSLSEIMKWNKLRKSSTLKPGMIIKIYKS